MSVVLPHCFVCYLFYFLFIFGSETVDLGKFISRNKFIKERPRVPAGRENSQIVERNRKSNL